jgi:DNA replication and repair protein RecF
MLNGHLAHDFASQGQQRSLVIAYKLAELRVLEELVHQKPILLLDDVMSELDAVRRETLTHHLTQAAQAFVTTTNLEYFTPSLLDEAQIVSLPTTA